MAPINLASPSIDGLARVGETLVGTTGEWGGEPPVLLKRRWLRCDAAGRTCAPIPRATGASLLLADEHVGAAMVFEVIASNDSGEARARSRATAPVAARPAVAPSNLEPPAIRGLARLDRTLAAYEGLWIGEPAPTLELQWLRCDEAACLEIAGETTARYTLSRSDVGNQIALRVTATNTAGTDTVVSRRSKPVEGEPLSLEPPAVSGIPTVRQRLVGRAGSWSAYPVPTISYQWLRCDEEGEGCAPVLAATGSTFLLTAYDAGHTFRVDVKASNALGKATARSNASPPVRLPPFNIRLPVVEYDYKTGRFTASPGEWGGYPAPRYTYRWQHCYSDGATCADIPGARRGPLYVPREGQPDCDIRVVVTAYNGAGTSTAVSRIVNSCVE